MSTQATPGPASEQGQPKEVPPLTDSYRKAYKSYVLVSGLLASWELIGITLDTKDKWGIELKSPSAVPLILFTLLLYSGYKMTIEWLQCDVERRQNVVATLDHWVAHGIALTAVLIGSVQYVSHIRIADVLTGKSGFIVFGFLSGFVLVYSGTNFLIAYRKAKGVTRRLRRVMFVGNIISFGFLLVYFFRSGSLALIAFIIGSGLGLGLYLLIGRKLRVFG